jgi:RND superfamily putative drug exporter
MILVAAAVVSIAMLMADATTTEMTFTNDPESLRGYHLIEEGFPEEGATQSVEFVLVRSPSLTLDDPEFQQAVNRIYSDLIALGPGVVDSAVFYYLPPDPAFPEEARAAFASPDRHSTFIQVKMAGSEDQAIENAGLIHSVTIDKQSPGDFEVLVTGIGSLNDDFRQTAENTLQSAEMVGIPIALLIMVVVFGAFLASAVPLILAGMAIIMAVGLTALVGQVWQVSYFATNMITMMGLAVGIDYALFIVSRYREERKRGLEKRAAIVKTGTTASHAVLFSGLTVLLALSGLMIVPLSLFRSLAGGAIFVVAMAIIITLTLLPALTYLLGKRLQSEWIHDLLRRLKPGSRHDMEGPNVDKKGGFWDWESSLVMRHPVISLLLSAGLLVAMALPALPVDSLGGGIRTGQASIEDFPNDLPGVKGFMELKKTFPFAFAPEAAVVIKADIQAPQTQQAIKALNAAIGADPALTMPVKPPEVSDNGDYMVLRYPLKYEPSSRDATDKIEELRQQVVPSVFAGVDSTVLVTGEAAENLDYYNITDSYRYVVIAFVLCLSFFLLMLVFRSLVVPLKAILMNLLSVFASYGLLVMVFQKGWGNELFGFKQVATIDAWIPLFLFAVLFGLSMDYHVFLLSRIRERYMLTGDNTESVAFGLRTTGGIITGAALIMVAIFAGFASGDLVMFQQMGFGMGAAVLLDATIIRSILVPSSMRLLGGWNWYLPRWLGWIPELHVEGREREGGDEAAGGL